MQRRSALLVRSAHARLGVDEGLQHAVVPGEGGAEDGGAPVVVLHVHGGAPGAQQPHSVHVALQRGVVQGGEAAPVAHVHRVLAARLGRRVLQQQVQHLHLAGVGSHVQRGHAPLVWQKRRGFVLQQRPHALLPPHESSKVQWGLAFGIRLAHLRSSLQERAHRGGVVIHSNGCDQGNLVRVGARRVEPHVVPRQRSHAVQLLQLASNVDWGATLDVHCLHQRSAAYKPIHHLHMTPLTSVMQGSASFHISQTHFGSL
mmetsp:Transcript_7765/g.14650  ORF Transcript_7765/g.14650 Transcript_7765/m.14650 type:complete len:258 (-) Transcript_7765:237-1010(-)